MFSVFFTRGQRVHVADPGDSCTLSSPSALVKLAQGSLGTARVSSQVDSVRFVGLSEDLGRGRTQWGQAEPFIIDS